MFRDVPQLQVERYFRQINNLRCRWDGNVRVVAVEGDSVDNSYERVYETAKKSNVDLTLTQLHHGGPSFKDHQDNPKRWRLMSKVQNELFGLVSTVADDIFVYIESDLVWLSLTIESLVEKVVHESTKFDIVVPLCIEANGLFYDVWGFRKDGGRFAKREPYHASLLYVDRDELVEIDSAGSCLVMCAQVAERVRIINDYSIVGWCQRARELGYRIAVDLNERVYHP